MKYLFGPVNSRRLGLSQGIDLIPEGVCNFNCIYCEIGKKKKLTTRRHEYSPTQDIIAEINSIFLNSALADAIDVFTITASGEPTLHSGIREIIAFVKSHTLKPVTVLTNGGTLHLADVRESLLLADIVVPSLDAVLPLTFQKINRPAPGSNIEKIIAGIGQFRKEFQGQLWLEILLVQGVNNSKADIQALKEAIETIQPDKIQLNTVVRPPIENFANPVTSSQLEEVAEELGGNIEIIANFNKKSKISTEEINRCDIIELLRRRPGTTIDLCQALRAEATKIESLLRELTQEEIITATKHSEQEYWILKETL